MVAVILALLKQGSPVQEEQLQIRILAQRYAEMERIISSLPAMTVLLEEGAIIHAI